jgi:hypothetical protein
MNRNEAVAPRARNVPWRVFRLIGAVLAAGSVVASVSCTSGTSKTASASSGAQVAPNPGPATTSPRSQVNTEETFIDSLELGRAGTNAVVLNQVRTSDSVYVRLLFLSKGKGRFVERNNSNWLKDGLSGLHAEVEDFNNDGYKDLTFVSSTAARGANEVRRLFIYDPLSDQLKFITNSMNYPNLRYNPKLKCIDGFRVYGGSSTDFLRLQGDSLFMFATVDLDEGVVVTTYDADQKGRVIHRDTTYEGGYIRFGNYSPLEVLEGIW